MWSRRDLRVHDRRGVGANQAAASGTQRIRTAALRRPGRAGGNPVDPQDRGQVAGHPQAASERFNLLAPVARLGGRGGLGQRVAGLHPHA